MKTYKDFEDMIQKLEQRNMAQDQYFRNYILNPYLTTGLGYDVYDIEFAEMKDSGSTFKFINPKTEDGANIYFSLKDSYHLYQDPNDRAYVYLDLMSKKITLYFKVFEEWYKVNQVTLFVEDEVERKEQEDALVSLNQTVYSERFAEGYESLGEKYFTSVVLDNMISKGDVLNVFVRRALIRELQNPTDTLIGLLAQVLTEYSTQSIDWIQDNLQEVKGHGVLPLLEVAISNGELNLKGIPQPTPKPPVTNTRGKSGFMEQKPLKVEEQPKNIIDDKLDLLKNSGFGVPKADESKQTPDTGAEQSKSDSRDDIGVQRNAEGMVDLSGLV